LLRALLPHALQVRLVCVSVLISLACVRCRNTAAACEIVQHILSPDFLLGTSFIGDAFRHQNALLLSKFCLGLYVFTWDACSLNSLARAA